LGAEDTSEKHMKIYIYIKRSWTLNMNMKL
jgi:hypothetical protein